MSEVKDYFDFGCEALKHCDTETIFTLAGEVTEDSDAVQIDYLFAASRYAGSRAIGEAQVTIPDYPLAS